MVSIGLAIGTAALNLNLRDRLSSYRLESQPALDSARQIRNLLEDEKTLALNRALQAEPAGTAGLAQIRSEVEDEIHRLERSAVMPVEQTDRLRSLHGRFVQATDSLLKEAAQLSHAHGPLHGLSAFVRSARNPDEDLYSHLHVGEDEATERSSRLSERTAQYETETANILTELREGTILPMAGEVERIQRGAETRATLAAGVAAGLAGMALVSFVAGLFFLRRTVLQPILRLSHRTSGEVEPPPLPARAPPREVHALVRALTERADRAVQTAREEQSRLAFLREAVAHLHQQLRDVREGDLQRDVDLDGVEEVRDLAREIREFIARLRATLEGASRAGRRLARVLHDVTAAAETTLRGADGQVPLLEQASQAAAELGGALQRTREAIDTLAEPAREAEDRTRKARRLLDETLPALTQGQDALRELSEKLDAWAEPLVDADHLVRTLASGVEQMQLLALNVSFEASRTGEAGKGFALAAEQMRAIIDRASQACRDLTLRLERMDVDARQVRRALHDRCDESARAADRLQSSTALLDAALAHTNRTSDTSQALSRDVARHASTAAQVLRRIESLLPLTEDLIRGSQSALAGLRDAREAVAVLDPSSTPPQPTPTPLPAAPREATPTTVSTARDTAPTEAVTAGETTAAPVEPEPSPAPPASDEDVDFVGMRLGMQRPIRKPPTREP